MSKILNVVLSLKSISKTFFEPHLDNFLFGA